ncbi:coatomer epsilon subunit [Schizosaccharomyces octosporus yFS286]|uniref:Coatomer subunit epsilon n=1 Tax=Schizosaccharomyces octosporus (strain yFS286) TaxID=483514 RepID=S9R2C3_SCHOY|nr:coatomer epsilon subunit [Schizosaccharomyces octosporus yFS286]EPX72535.1 coatomer epsilon subunit [Schizosaccharomyces octosporus yFS286]
MFSWEASLSNELYFVRQYFYSGSYDKLSEIDTSSLSEKGLELTELYMARAKLALGESIESIQGTLTQKSAGGAALLALAGEGNMDHLIEQHGDTDAAVQTLGAIYLIHKEAYDEALSLLQKSVENLEAVALEVYIRLYQHKLEAAEAAITKSLDWADEEIVLQIAQSWVKLAKGGLDSYNDAFYVYEELNGSESNPRVLTCMACSDLCLLRTQEAVSSLRSALEMQSDYTPAAANLKTAVLALGPLAPLDAKQLYETSSCGAFLAKQLNQKSQEFDTLATQFLANSSA